VPVTHVETNSPGHLWRKNAERMRLGSTALCIALLWSAVFPSTAAAWGQRGHQLIASLAEAQLTPRTRDEVQRLLALEPGATLESISTWADEHRNPATAAWHYVNFPRISCTYDAGRDCPGGQCVVGALERQLGLLKSASSDEKKLRALKYVVHLVGDVHQPLHAGFADDRGGNSYQLQAFGKGTNLHALWDSGLLNNLNESSQTTLRRLERVPVTDGERSSAMVTAAEESCRIAAGAEFYPGRKLNDEYVAGFTPMMEEQLILAGARLAVLLNDAFR
jgi:hypothetical protein